MSTAPQLRLRLVDPGIDEFRLQSLAREMVSSLHSVGHMQARLPRDVSRPGQRGDQPAVGEIAVELAGAASVASLIEVFNAYFARRAELAVEIDRPDGGKLRIMREDLSGPHFDDIMEDLRRIAGA